MHASRKQNAFTLVEIMIVVLIIGILATIAVPNFMTARLSSQAKMCVSNLFEIRAAKEQWAMENGKAAGITPSISDLLAGAPDGSGYMKAWPTCAAHGTYSINDMNTNPTCSISGHVMK